MRFTRCEIASHATCKLDHETGGWLSNDINYSYFYLLGVGLPRSPYLDDCCEAAGRHAVKDELVG